jgi:hypothetical protein
MRICVLLLMGSHSLIPWTTPRRTPAPRTNETSVGRIPPGLGHYFLSPTDRFLRRRSDAWHFLHLVAASGFLEPHFRQTFRKSRFFCAICFFVTSAMGNCDRFFPSRPRPP